MDRCQLFAAQAQSLAALKPATDFGFQRHRRLFSLGKVLTLHRNPVSMRPMEIRTIGLTVAFSFLGAAVCMAADPQMGTWKLNESKSKITPGTLKNTQVVYSSMFGQVKIKADGIDGNGKPSRTEWSGKFDGKDYPVTGDPNSDARSYTKVNERTLTTTNKKNGKVTVTGQIVVSPDGKTRTITLTGTTPKGKKFKNVAVYDKQ